MKRSKCLLLLIILPFFSAPVLGQQFEVMVYTSPDRWHDATIPAALQRFQKLSELHNFGLTWAQPDGSGSIGDPFSTDFLAGIDAVVFLNARGNDLSDEQLANFREYIHNGGGFVGIHATSVDDGQDEWLLRLTGRAFTHHPEIQTAVYHVIDKKFPATMHLPDRWVFTGEMYSFGEELSDNLNYLITLDEGTYDTAKTWGSDLDTAMGEFHPVAWYQEFEGGRSFYTALGHLPASWNDPLFSAHIYGGIYWAATGYGITE
ncbi:ThuA domain-containing protein [Balneolales bacterium ANBcel1]|nr:ThuA domain-containing protein [Balneolales bacterium ANBcel1]